MGRAGEVGARSGGSPVLVSGSSALHEHTTLWLGERIQNKRDEIRERPAACVRTAAPAAKGMGSPGPSAAFLSSGFKAGGTTWGKLYLSGFFSRQNLSINIRVLASSAHPCHPPLSLYCCCCSGVKVFLSGEIKASLVLT